MMMNIRKQRLAVAVAGTLGLMASSAQAVEFTATTTLQNTLAVTAITPMDIGTVFAAQTGAVIGDGVGVMNISADGSVDYDNTSPTVSLMSLGAPVPAQGSVDSANNFTLQLPDTKLITAATFSDGSGTLADILDETKLGTAGYEAVELRVSADETIPALYLVHFQVGDVSGGAASIVLPEVVANANDGVFEVDMEFDETTYVFNIGATVITQPSAGSALDYEEGTYSGTFEVTASY